MLCGSFTASTIICFLDITPIFRHCRQKMHRGRRRQPATVDAQLHEYSRRWASDGGKSRQRNERIGTRAGLGLHCEIYSRHRRSDSDDTGRFQTMQWLRISYWISLEVTYCVVCVAFLSTAVCMWIGLLVKCIIDIVHQFFQYDFHNIAAESRYNHWKHWGHFYALCSRRWHAFILRRSSSYAFLSR